MYNTSTIYVVDVLKKFNIIVNFKTEMNLFNFYLSDAIFIEIPCNKKNNKLKYNHLIIMFILNDYFNVIYSVSNIRRNNDQSHILSYLK